MRVGIRGVLLGLTILLVACGNDIEPGMSPEADTVVSGLTLAPVVRQATAEGPLYPGTVESRDRATLTARIDGRVAVLAAAEGARVTAGEELLRLTDNTAAAALQQAERQRDAAAAQAQLAATTLTRFRALIASGAVAAQELDRVAAEEEAARQALAAAEAAVAQARTAAGFNRVLAPFAGQVARHLVREGGTVLPGTPLLLLDRDVWQVRAEIPDSASLAVGQPVVVEIGGTSVPGAVRELLPGSDPRSRSQQALIDLAAAGLRAGLYAPVRLATAGASRLLAPAPAIVTRGQLTGVYAVDGDRLRWRLVQLGRSVGDRVEILSGLREGEQVVVAGQERAVDGARLGASR